MIIDYTQLYIYYNNIIVINVNTNRTISKIVKSRHSISLETAKDICIVNVTPNGILNVQTFCHIDSTFVFS